MNKEAKEVKDLEEWEQTCHDIITTGKLDDYESNIGGAISQAKQSTESMKTLIDRFLIALDLEEIDLKEAIDLLHIFASTCKGISAGLTEAEAYFSDYVRCAMYMSKFCKP